jgi:hypothetical protein
MCHVAENLSLRHVYCVPNGFEQLRECKEALQLLSRVNERLSIPFENRRITNEDEASRVKMELLPLSVSSRLGVHKSAKGKSLYPQLLIYEDSDLVAFFPQMRKAKNGRLEVRITEYLNSLLSGSLKSLVSIPALEEKVPRKQVVDDEELKAGYTATAREVRKTMAEWSSVELPWPE